MFKKKDKCYIVIVLKNKQKYKIECHMKIIEICKAQMKQTDLDFVDLYTYQFNKNEILYIYYNY